MKRTPLKRKTPMRRTAMKRGPTKVRSAKEGGDPVYLDWIRSLDCCGCNTKPPCHPHHSTGAGMGLKSSDREAMPLCWRCHRDFHDGKGVFDGWGRDARRVWQELQVERALYLYGRLYPEKLLNAP